MVSLSMTRLRTASWALTVTQIDTVTPLPLSGGKVLWFFAKKYLTDHDNASVIRKNSASVGGITVTDAPNGLATLQIDPADTDAVRSGGQGQMIFPCEFVLIDGSNRYELDTGTIAIGPNVSVPE